MRIKDEVWEKALDDIIMRTDGDIEKMTVSDLIVLKIIANSELEWVEDVDLYKYLMAWTVFDIEKWIDNAHLGVEQRIKEAMTTTSTTLM